MALVVAGVTKSLKDDGTVGGWRDELYPVTTDFYAKPLLLMERAAAVHFGIKVTGRVVAMPAACLPAGDCPE